MTEPKCIYIFDTSSFILLGSLPDDILTFIWNQITELIKENRLITPLEVKKEILEYARDDLIKIWLTETEKRYHLIRGPTVYQIKKIEEIQTRYKQFVDTESDKPYADPWLITLALELMEAPQSCILDETYEYYLVTEENQSSSKKNLANPPEVTKIPDFCNIYGIKFINFWNMIRKEGWQWI